MHHLDARPLPRCCMLANGLATARSESVSRSSTGKPLAPSRARGRQVAAEASFSAFSATEDLPRVNARSRSRHAVEACSTNSSYQMVHARLLASSGISGGEGIWLLDRRCRRGAGDEKIASPAARHLAQGTAAANSTSKLPRSTGFTSTARPFSVRTVGVSGLAVPGTFWRL